MKKKKILFISLLIMLIFSSCMSMDERIATAIAITETAVQTMATKTLIPTNTPTPTNTVTPTNTSTSTPTLTNTPTQTPTPTPDVRIIDSPPEIFILNQEQLNYLGKDSTSPPSYGIPDSSYVSPHTNQEIIGVRGKEEGNAYLAATGRIIGYYKTYANYNYRKSIQPDAISMFVVSYKTINGPKVLIDEYNSYPMNRIEFDFDFSEFDVPYIYSYGESTRISNGNYNVIYYLEFYYRNMWVDITAYDEVKLFNDEYFDFDYVHNVGLKMLELLKEYELSEPIE